MYAPLLGLEGMPILLRQAQHRRLILLLSVPRADFSALPTSVQEAVWQEAVTRLTVLLRKPVVCQFNKYRPEEARLHVDALSGFNLPQLLVPYLTPAKKQKMSRIARKNPVAKRRLLAEFPITYPSITSCYPTVQ